MNGNPISLYFHIPFCTQKCPYCHFYSVVDEEPLKDRFFRALSAEVDRWKERLLGREIVSVYFGGGTPFLFGPKKIAHILNQLSAFSLSDTCEITLEANPETTYKAALEEYRAIGVNRLSIGAQSFTACLLTTLQRRHTPEDTLQAIVDSIASGFSNISIDLMYDLPGLTIATWKETLEAACRLPIQHLSLYNLTIEPKTAWFRKKSAIEALMPHDEESLLMYQAALDITASYGFRQYEISAFAREGYSSRHNAGYWQGREFLGFGPSAFSFYNGQRFSNISNVIGYCAALESNASPIDVVDDTSSEKRLREMVAIGLRMNEGICLESLERVWGQADNDLLLTLDHLVSHQLLHRAGALFSLTDQGRVVYDALAVELI